MKTKAETHHTLGWRPGFVMAEHLVYRIFAAPLQIIANNLEAEFAENTKVTTSMLMTVFLEQKAGIPFWRHPALVGMFDTLGHGRTFGAEKTHRTPKSAAKMTRFISTELHQRLCSHLQLTESPIGLVVDESKVNSHSFISKALLQRITGTDVSAEPHLIIYVRHYKVNINRLRLGFL